jgi:mono/diheme cytochrome c family protein
MKKIINIAFVIIFSTVMVSCFNKEVPNYQFMPNMYEPVDYETYSAYEMFSNEQSAMLAPEGTIPRGWKPYEYENSIEGLNLARAELKIPFDVTEKNLKEGKELYTIYCSVCHGDKGDGQGILVKREKFLGIPSYSDPGRDITEGSIYHVMMYGINAMGSHASQTNEKERWQIAMHVLNLRASLKGEPLLKLVNYVVEEESTEINVLTDNDNSKEEH